MHICLDAPTPSQLVDVRGFNVRGWSWLDAAHDELVAVEVWTGDKLLGSTEKLGLSSDVIAELKLPAGVRTGFHLVARHPRADVESPFEINLRLRLRDGSHLGPFCLTVVTPARLTRARLAKPASTRRPRCTCTS
jgi:hypothetical protein